MFFGKIKYLPKEVLGLGAIFIVGCINGINELNFGSIYVSA
jgi:hypothetical protein